MRFHAALRRFRATMLLLAGLAGALLAASAATAVERDQYIADKPSADSFPLATGGDPAPMVVAADDWPGVKRVAKLFQGDVEQVAGKAPKLVEGDATQAGGKTAVLIGTLGHSALIDGLVAAKKIDAAELSGKREKFIIQAVDAPIEGLDRALVIAGSDKRGTIYGMFDLSAQIGVSPWAWWADAPVKPQNELHVAAGKHTHGEPAVEYRGIFINDEAPALSGWMAEKLGGCNSKFYTHVFELILRLRGNFLWPAMWGRSIYEDDPESARLADEFGIVLSTSHHEPMMRAQADWGRFGRGSGPWSYEKNAEMLRKFWHEGIRRTNDYERMVTVGMRGDGDEPMSQDANIALLERIVADQRKIIAEETGLEPSATPQVWALYKEVQDYYDKGMRVPDDVCLFLCDDNWGNIRKLPKLDEPLHSGGYGIYYHFDYVGGPRNYKWLNTNPLPRIWEQMHLAYEHNARKIWLVNVGDIKPMEFPIEFFLDYAWDPTRWSADDLDDYTRLWAERQFGAEHAESIADLLANYAKYNSRRKPELLAPETYSLVNFGEAERIVGDYGRLADEAAAINDKLPAEARDAFFQLVLYPVQACANLNELYLAAAKNRLYARQGRAEANAYADRVTELFDRDAALSRQYNELKGGKWRHMMDQTHIGYTNWQEPPKNTPPKTERVDVSSAPGLGVAIEGSESSWPSDSSGALPELSPYTTGERWIEVFNRGEGSVDFTVEVGEKWVTATPAKGSAAKSERIAVTADWSKAPDGLRKVPIRIKASGGETVVVVAVVNKPVGPKPVADAFVEADGYVAIEAEHTSRRVDGEKVKWGVLPDFGRTLSGVTVFPTNVPQAKPGGDSPHLEYKVWLADGGPVTVRAIIAPTQDFTFSGGLEYAVSFDDQEPQRVNINKDTSVPAWERDVANNVSLTTSEHDVAAPGEHVLKFWMVDPGVVLEKIVIDRGKLPASYLGPPESQQTK